MTAAKNSMAEEFTEKTGNSFFKGVDDGVIPGSY